MGSCFLVFVPSKLGTMCDTQEMLSNSLWNEDYGI